MEDALSNYFMDFVMTALGTAVFTLIGFVWKISHKVSAVERQLKHEREVRQRDSVEFRRELDMIISNVDKNREWSTNRMMSIVRDSPRYNHIRRERFFERTFPNKRRERVDGLGTNAGVSYGVCIV